MIIETLALSLCGQVEFFYKTRLWAGPTCNFVRLRGPAWHEFSPAGRALDWQPGMRHDGAGAGPARRPSIVPSTSHSTFEALTCEPPSLEAVSTYLFICHTVTVANLDSEGAVTAMGSLEKQWWQWPAYSCYDQISDERGTLRLRTTTSPWKMVDLTSSALRRHTSMAARWPQPQPPPACASTGPSSLSLS